MSIAKKAVAFICWLAGLVSGFFARIVISIRKNKKVCWYLSLVSKYVLVAFILLTCGFVGARIGQKKALETYWSWMDDYKLEQERLTREAYESDPYTIQLNEEAELLAKVLYGVKDNKSDDLRTCCWCVFNRVDNEHYPDTLEDVIAQPNQWMRYDPTNPILESLYKIAREQLDRWHTDSHRPISNDYVFMNWSANDICLRDVWAEGSGTHYWRWGK